MKKITLALFAFAALCFTMQVQAQTEIPQPTAGTSTLTAGVDFVDGDIYTDSGGSTGLYLNDELGTLEFCANPGEVITIDFTAFEVEASGGAGGQCWDQLTISGDTGGMDGTYAGDTFDLGAGLACIDGTDPAGNPTLGPFNSAPGGCLTFFFDSDGSVTQSGWEADISVAVDPNAPLINCPMDVMVNTSPGVCTGVANFADAVAIDPNGGTVTVTQTMGPPSGSDFPLGDTIVEFTATNDDAPNESTSCQFTVTVVDNQAPSITCPADIVVDNDAGVCGANVTIGQPTIMDNCASSGVITGDTGQVALNHNTAGLIDTPVTLTGMATTTDAMVTVNITYQGDFGTLSTECFDLEGPDGSQVFFECGTTQCAVFNRSFDVDQATWNGWIGTYGTDLTFVLQEDAQVDDNLCGGAFPDGFYQLATSYNTGGIPMGATLVNDFNGTDDASDFYPVGTTTVTWTYTDQGGNTAQCTMDVTVNDVEAPMVSCIGTPGPAVGMTNDMTVVPIPDNDPAGVSTTITVSDVGTVLDLNVDLDISHTWVGDLIVTLTSPDNTTVTLIDRMGIPGSTFGCDENDLQITLDDEAGAPIETECSGSPISGSFTPNDLLSAFDGETMEGDWILTISDNAGGDTGELNEWTLNYDYDSPGIPLDVVLDANGMATIAASSLVTGFNDNCGPGGVTITGGVSNPMPGTISTLFDGGNGGSPGGAIYFDVTVGASDITLTDLEIHTGEAGAFTMDVYAFAGTYVGNETNAGAWGTPVAVASGTSAGAGNPSPATLDVPVVLAGGTTYAMAFVLDGTHGHDYTNGDGTNEQYSNADLTIDLGSATNAPFTGTVFNPRVFNGTLNYMVGGASSSGLFVDLTCAELGLTDILITATDAAGNTSTCTAVVNVLDQTPPVLICMDVTIELDETGMASIEPEDLLLDVPAVYDVVTISSNNASGAVGTTDLTMTVATAETVSFDWDYVTMDGPDWDSFGYVLNGVYTELTDPAGANTQSGNSGPIDLVPGDVFGFRSQSEDGFAGAATTTVSNFVPGFDGQFDPANWTLTLNNSDGNAFFVEVVPGIPGAFDACGITTMAVDINDVDCDDIANSPLTATVFATDASGNLAACQSMITVVDLLGPEVTCPPDQTIDPGPGNLFYEVPDYWANGDATATDNCTDPLTVFSQDPAAGTLLGDGIYTVSICSTDEYGNQGCCTFELTIESILGNASNDLNTAISMYPNPASDQVILANGSNILLDNAMIYDMNGKLINTIDLQNMGSEMSIDVSALASGVYMVQINSDGATAIKRLLKE